MPNTVSAAQDRPTTSPEGQPTHSAQRRWSITSHVEPRTPARERTAALRDLNGDFVECSTAGVGRFQPVPGPLQCRASPSTRRADLPRAVRASGAFLSLHKNPVTSHDPSRDDNARDDPENGGNHLRCHWLPPNHLPAGTTIRIRPPAVRSNEAPKCPVGETLAPRVRRKHHSTQSPFALRWVSQKTR